MQRSHISSFIHKLLRKSPPIEADDSAMLNDLSYEDALLDVQLRSFFRAEYGRENPPQGVFPRLMRAIRLVGGEQRTSSKTGMAGQLGQTLATIYRRGICSNMGRSLSGALVTAFLMLAMGPNISELLNGRPILGTDAQFGRPGNPSAIASTNYRVPSSDGDSMAGTTITPAYPAYSGQTVSNEIEREQARRIMEQKTGEYSLSATRQQENAYLDPIELGITQRGQDRTHTLPRYMRQTSGPE